MIFSFGISRALGFQDSNFQVYDMEVKDNQITFTVKHAEPARYICKHCGHPCDSYHDKESIFIHDGFWNMHKVVWKVERMRILCHRQTGYRVESMPFKSPKHFLTQRFVDFIEFTLCTKMMTVADVARLCNLNYGIVYKIDHDVLIRLWQNAKIPDPINIAVDEVSKDLHKPYIASCQQYIPQAIEVADSFHVVKKLNEVLDECRKELIESSETPKAEKKILKEMNWVIRYTQENMSEKNLSKLDQLERLNEPLYRAYLHKESFFEFFTFKPGEEKAAGNFLDEWVKDALTVPINAFQQVVGYITRHRDRIINIITTGRSSSLSEAINRKINVIIGMAYGYHCLHYLKLKILQRCGIIGKYWTLEFGSILPQNQT